MSPLGRALLGATLGALLVLMFHPETRPYYSTLWNIGDSAYLSRSTLLPENVSLASLPTTREEAAYWLLLVTERQKLAARTNRRVLEDSVAIARQFAAEDIDNAFWPQIEAFYLWRLGRSEEAEESWSRASRLLRWNDYENARLNGLAAGLAEEADSTLAWHYAYAYTRRSNAIVQAIRRYALFVVDRSALDEPGGIAGRKITILNGDLLRRGARSYAQATIGADIVNLSTLPSAARPIGDRLAFRRQISESQANFAQRLMAIGDLDGADRVRLAFSDAQWMANTSPAAIQDEANRRVKLCLATATLPGALVFIAALGVFLLGVGAFLEGVPALQNLLRPPWAQVLAVAFAAQIYLVTNLFIPAFAIGLCFAFFGYEPANVRRVKPEQMGWLFVALIAGLGAVLAVTLVAFGIGLGAPAIRIFPVINVPREFDAGSAVLISIAQILLGLVLLTAPGWSRTTKYAAPRIAAHALTLLGRGLFVGGLVLAIASGLIAYVADSRLADEMLKRIRNEPRYVFDERLRRGLGP